jgi:hypothetical protein
MTEYQLGFLGGALFGAVFGPAVTALLFWVFWRRGEIVLEIRGGDDGDSIN